MTTQEILGLLEGFVPEPLQTSARDFCAYLVRLKYMRYNMRYSSIEVKKEGISFYVYRPHYTPNEFLTWAEIMRHVANMEKFRGDNFKERLKEINPDLFEQLDKAF